MRAALLPLVSEADTFSLELGGGRGRLRVLSVRPLKGGTAERRLPEQVSGAAVLGVLLVVPRGWRL